MRDNPRENVPILSSSLCGPENGFAGVGDAYTTRCPRLGSERGVVLLMTIILSAAALAVITALIYLVMTGTQTSGSYKKYRTALDAGLAASEIVTQAIAVRGDISTFTGGLTGLNASVNPGLNACIGTVSSSGTASTISGSAVKLLASSLNWTNCGDRTLSAGPLITGQTTTNYDFKFQLGTNPKYNVYAKIVDVVEGNSSSAGSSGVGGVPNLESAPVVGGGSGGGSSEIDVPSRPYLYTIEIEAENAAAGSGERARLSILYQY